MAKKIEDDFNFKRLVKMIEKLPSSRRAKFIEYMEKECRAELRGNRPEGREAVQPREFARRVGVTVGTVRRWLRVGTVKAEKYGPRLWFIPVSELRRMKRKKGRAVK